MKPDPVSFGLWDRRYTGRSLQNSTSIDLFNAFWWPVIPIAKSRENTILALQNHYLITVRDEVMIEITDKGRDYLQWRGPLPYIPSPKSS